jgi:hypothetical protein
MAKATRRDWHVGQIGQACREVALSGHLTLLAREAEICGFPFTAEHLRHLAGFVLDEAAAKYDVGRPDLGEGGPGVA